MPWAVDLKTKAQTFLPHLCKYRIFVSLLANPQVHPQQKHHSLDAFGVVFLTRVTVDNVSSFLLYPRALHVSLARVLDFSLMVTTHNSTVLKVNSMTEDIFICIFLVKKFLYLVTRHKMPYILAHNISVSFFSSSYMHQPCHLDGCQAINSFSTCIFNALRFL